MTDDTSTATDPAATDQQPSPNTTSDFSQDATVLAVLAVLVAGPPIAKAVAKIVDETGEGAVEVLSLLKVIGYTASGTPLPGKLNTAAKAARLQNLRYRAAFFVNALKRLSNTDGDLKPALAQEKKWFAAHKKASAKRVASAKVSDHLSNMYNTPLLGWYATLDSRTTPDCAFLDGNNYEALHPPGDLHPGARHPRCRCVSGPPFMEARTITDDDMPAEFDTQSG